MTNLKLSSQKVICFILLLPFYEPLLFKESDFIHFDFCYSCFKILCLFIICILFLKYNLFQKKVSIITVLTVLYLLVLLISTVINGGDLVKFCGPTVSTVGLVLLTEIYFRKLKIEFFAVIRIVLIFLLIINVLLQCVFPQGILPEVNFLGIDNRLVFFYLPLIFYTLAYDYYSLGKVSFLSILAIFMALWSLLTLWAVGGFLGIIVLCISLVVSKFHPINKISLAHIVTFMLLINLLVVFFQIQNYFEDFLVNVLHKDITITGRTYLWDFAINYFYKFPLLGYGIQSDNFLRSVYFWVVHPHNIFLSYLTISGLVGITIYILTLYILANRTKKIINSNLRIISISTVFVILFMSLADTLDSSFFIQIYIVIYLMPEVWYSYNSRRLNFFILDHKMI